MQPPIVEISNDAENIIELIDGKINNLELHLEYINDIQNGKISAENTREYLREALFIKVPHNTDAVAIAIFLKSAVQKLLKKFQTIKDICFIGQDILAKCMLHVFITLQLENETEHNYKYAKAKNINADFNEKIVYKSLLKIIAPDFKEYIKELQSVFKVASNKEEVLDFNWDKTIQSLRELLITAKNLLLTLDNNSVASNSPQDYTDLLTSAFASMAAQKSKNLSTIYHDDESGLYNFIKDNCEVFLKYYKAKFLLSELYNNSSTVKNDLAYKLELEKDYHNKKTTLGTELDLLLDRYKSFIDRFQKISLSEQNILNPDTLMLIKTSLGSVLNKIVELRKQWPKTLPEYYIRKEEVNAAYTKSSAEIELVKEQLCRINEQFLTQLALIKVAQERAKAAEEQKQQLVALEALKEKAKFIADQTAACQRYKQEVQADREAKAAARFTPKTIPIVPIVTTYKNVDMEAKLLTLSEKQLLHILSILKEEPGTYYQEVYNIIESHLGGKLLNIGNGSSHRRIILNKYSVDISHIPGKPEPALPKNPVATGGMFKPKGRGEIINFNMILLNRVFEKAGITEKVIQKILDQKRELAKSAGPTI